VSIDLESTLIFLGVLIPSIILHEISHGLVAYWCGDDTAKRAGRLTLNPVPHIDPFGSIILPLLLSLTSFGVFGFAKPVPVNVGRLRSPRNQAVLVSLAGPATNILIALFAAFVLRTFTLEGTAVRVVVDLGVVNVVLAAFNLLPFPPLDGSAVVERFMPRSWYPQWLKIRQYTMGVLIIIVLALPRVLNSIFIRAIDLWAHLL
jgi:Zn-dependent protease